MKIALLFVLIFNTGCVADVDVDVDGCTGGWFEFKCAYSSGQGQNVKVSFPGRPELSLTYLVGNRWRELDDIRSVYHNTTGKYWRVLVKNLGHNDFDEYKCKWKNQKTTFELKKGNRACDTSSRTVYRGSQTTIQCAPNYGNFICKENPTEPECDILNLGPVYSLSAATEQDQGTYWCGYQPEGAGSRFRVARQKIQLQVVNVTQNSLRLSPGQNSSYPCLYPDGVPLQKFVCKEDNSTACTNISRKFSLKDVPENQTVIITVHGVTEEDSGWYWVGAESSDTNEKHFFHKLLLLVQSENVTFPNKNNTDPIYPTPSSQPHKQDTWKSIVIGVVVSAILLLLATALMCLHRHRCCFFKVPTVNKEDHPYDEIQERPLQLGAAALNTIYTTATLDTVMPGPDNGENKQSADEAFKDNILYMQHYS